MNIGDRLRRLRKERQLSLEEIAQRSGLHCTDLREVENQNMVPPIEILQAIAKVLEIELHELFFDGGTPPPLPNLPARQSANAIAFGVSRGTPSQIRFASEQEFSPADSED